MGTGVGEAAAAGSAKGAGAAAGAGAGTAAAGTAAAGTAAAAGTGAALGTGITAAGTAAGAGAMGAGALGTGITAAGTAAGAGAMGAGALGTGLTAGAVGLGAASALGGGAALGAGAGLYEGAGLSAELAAGAPQTNLWQDIYGAGKQLVDNPLGKYIVQQGLTSAIGARAESKQQQALQDQLSRIASINNTSYGASQASPVGLIGSGGRALDPAATAAGMSRSAPILPGVAAIQGTQAAPTTPRAQIGAVRLGVRPRQYGG